MTKPGDSQTKKTIYELAKEFPNKIYKELEKYRNADRQEEAQARCDYLQVELDRVKRENNDLHNKVAALLDSDAALRKARESGL